MATDTSPLIFSHLVRFLMNDSWPLTYISLANAPAVKQDIMKHILLVNDLKQRQDKYNIVKRERESRIINTF